MFRDAGSRQWEEHLMAQASGPAVRDLDLSESYTVGFDRLLS